MRSKPQQMRLLHNNDIIIQHKGYLKRYVQPETNNEQMIHQHELVIAATAIFKFINTCGN